MIKGALQSKKVNIFIIDNYNKDAILQQIITNRIKCWFLRRGENRTSIRRKTSRSRVENQQTQPTYDAESGNRTRATLVEGECSATAPTLLPWGRRVIEDTSYLVNITDKILLPFMNLS